jgi:rod shape-determining protein MreC
MQQIIDFIIRKKDVVVYLILLSFSFALILNSNYFQKSKALLFSSNISNYTTKNLNYFNEYFKLKELNYKLSEENLVLKNQLEKTNESSVLDSLTNENFLYKNAKVISNNLSSFKNRIIVNKGIRDGIKNEMGVISSDGIVGIIDNTTKRYSSIMSILNIEMKINAKVKRTEHFGTLEWDGFDTRHLTLNDISETAKIKVGDSIITGGMSLIFPEGINIGIVSKIINQNETHSNTKGSAFTVNIRDDSIIDLDIRENYLNIEVKLHNDMSNLNNVYIIESFNKKEFQKLKK